MVAKPQKENERARTQSTTAEEAVDQLQASEKLIAGMMLNIVVQNIH